MQLLFWFILSPVHIIHICMQTIMQGPGIQTLLRFLPGKMVKSCGKAEGKSMLQAMEAKSCMVRSRCNDERQLNLPTYPIEIETMAVSP